MKFTEAQLEQAFIDLLGKEDIPYLPGNVIQRDPVEVLIKEDLKAFLNQKYIAEEITASEIEGIIRELEKFPASDLYESNKAIMKMLSDGFLLKREDRSKKDIFIQLLDFPAAAAREEAFATKSEYSVAAEDSEGYFGCRS
jgi:type I restriction enzyme, R subunit